MSFKEVKLKYIATLNPSKSELNLAAFKNKTVSFLPMDKIISPNNLDLSLEKTVEEVYSGYTYFRENDIVLAKVTPCFENGNIAVAKELKNGIGFGTTELHVLRVDEQLYDKEYIYYCLQLENFKAKAVANMYGVGGLKRIPTEFLSEYKFLVPDLKTQVAIRKYLNLKLTEISSLIENKNKLIKLLEQQRQSIITEAVTKGLNPNVKMKDSGVEWIGEIPEHWSILPLKYIASEKKNSFVDGPFGSDLKNEEYVDSGVPVIQLNNIKNGKLRINNMNYVSEEKSEQLRRHTAYPDDLVIAKMASPIARSAVVPNMFQKYVIVADCIKLKLKENYSNAYINYAMNTPFTIAQAKAFANGTTRSRVNLGIIKNLKVPIPHFEEQKEIVSYLEGKISEMDNVIKSVEKQISKLKEYRQALIYEAVTGKIDVRDMELD